TIIGTATTVTVSNSGTASTSYTIPAGTATGTYTVAAVYHDNAATPVYLDSSDSTHTLTSTGPATHFSVAAPSPLTAGNGFLMTVTAQDQFNNTAMRNPLPAV